MTQLKWKILACCFRHFQIEELKNPSRVLNPCEQKYSWEATFKLHWRKLQLFYLTLLSQNYANLFVFLAQIALLSEKL